MLVVLGAILGWLALAEGEAASAAPGTCSIYSTGASSISWSAAANWSLTDNGPNAGRLPNSTDVICMSTAPTRQDVQVSDARAVAGVNFADTPSVDPSLRVLGCGSLAVGSAVDGAFDSTINNLRLVAGSTLTGTADVLVTSSGTGATIANVTISGPGKLTLGPSVSVTTTPTLDGRPLVNQGTLTQTASALNLYNGARVENQGIWNAPTSGGFFVNTDSTPGVEFRNTVTGQVNVSPGAGNSFLFYAPLVNNGTITTTSGSLQIAGGVSGTGSFVQTTPGELTVASGKTVDVTGLTFSGTGVVHVVSGEC